MTTPMTTYPPHEELEEEGYRPPPRPLAPRPPDNVAQHGFAEIKPNTTDQINEGLVQLRKHEPFSHSRWLLTYLPLDHQGRPVTARRGAHAVHVYGLRFKNRDSVPQTSSGLAGRLWYDLGKITLPKHALFPSLAHPGAFGFHVESLVRTRFTEHVLGRRGIKRQRATGGNRPGADIIWELAEFYSELARELAAESASFRF